MGCLALVLGLGLVLGLRFRFFLLWLVLVLEFGLCLEVILRIDLCVSFMVTVRFRLGQVYD